MYIMCVNIYIYIRANKEKGRPSMTTVTEAETLLSRPVGDPCCPASIRLSAWEGPYPTIAAVLQAATCIPFQTTKAYTTLTNGI